MKNQFTTSPNRETIPMKKKTYYHLVLDRSGSMLSCWSEVRQVIKIQLLGLKRIQTENPNSEIIFSYCGFNQVLQFSEKLMNVENATIDWSTIYPDGMTSLYDAIGESIDFVKKKAGEELKSEDSDVVMLVMTDGHENASRKHTALDIKEIIQSCEQTEKWNFLFLGAGLDVRDVTSAFDRGNRNSFSFEKQTIITSFNIVNDEIEDYIKQKERNQKKRDFFDKGDMSF